AADLVTGVVRAGARRCLSQPSRAGRLVAVEAQRTVDCRTAGRPYLTLDSSFLHNRAMEDSGMRVRRLALLVAVGSALMAGGCVAIPSLGGNRIALSDVVELVKCGLADALP